MARTQGLRRIGQRGATGTYAGWHEFAKAGKPYALFREDGDATLFSAALDFAAELEWALEQHDKDARWRASLDGNPPDPCGCAQCERFRRTLGV